MYNIEDIKNKIIYGDNLDELRKIPDDSIDLVYLDPPFFSGRNYEVIWGEGDHQVENKGFSDTKEHFKEDNEKKKNNKDR